MRIGFTCSTFDLLHAGHVMMLREAKAQCDYLICGLQVDPSIDRPEKNSPIQSIVEREAQLSAIKYVDEVIIYCTEDDLCDIINMYPIDIRILGEEYRDRDFTGKQYCIDNGIELFFHLRRHQYSSTELRNRVYKLEKIKKEEKVGEVIEQYSPKLLNKYVDNEGK